MVNNKKNILYLGYFGSELCKDENRSDFPAATTKMKYITNVIKQNGSSVILLSMSDTSNSINCKGHNFHVDDREEIVFFDSFGLRGFFSRIVRKFQRSFHLRKFFKKNISSDDTVLVYHSLGYARTIMKLKKQFKFRMILEVEEIYSDVTGNEKTRSVENNLFQMADAYIFPTILLNQQINTYNKPYCIIHGTYQAEQNRDKEFNDGRIHVVYAGTLDPRKGGAAAAAAAEFLDERYHMHIIGFGNDADIKNLLDTVEKVSKKTKCIISYDGLKSGEEYIRFLQSCDIGLSTQNPQAAFNNTSFPSKVLSYMSNGLRVVSIKIDSLITSAVNESLYYYEQDTPQAIATAIKNVDINDNYNSRDTVRLLSQQVQRELLDLI